MKQAIRILLTSLFLCCCLLTAGTSYAKVDAAKYGVQIALNRGYQQQTANARLDSMLRKHPQMNLKTIVAVERLRVMNNKTIDFYLLVIMLVILGIIRYTNPRYFYSLWRAFSNPTLSNRQLKDQIEVASFQSFVMNCFFAISGGAYIYYVVRLFMPQASQAVNPSMLLLMLIGGMLTIYLVKYLIMKFSGWAFRVEGITDDYIFNVFLINKVMAIALIPFTLLMAFGAPALAGPALIVSFIIVGVLLINRYTRSWSVFGSFFQYSRFHFFMYLCASELLPLALLMKLLVRGLNI